MTVHRSALPRFSSFDGLQNAADAAGYAFVPAADEDKAARRPKWETPALFAAGFALAFAAAAAAYLLA